MFNLHVGLPGIAADLFVHDQLDTILGKAFSHRIVRDELWKENVRSAVNNGEGDSRSTRLVWELARDTVRELAALKATAISQHALLGRSGDGFLKSKAFPKAFERISHLSDIFLDQPLTLHLTVASQFDYLKMAMERSNKVQPFSVPKIVPSWSDLVFRIKDAAPERQIVVWDFEQPRKSSVAFIVNMLDLTDDETVSNIYEWVAKAKLWDDYGLYKPDMSSISQELAEELDAQFEIDLEEIDGMSNVTLIRPNRIPVEFYL